MVWPFKKKIDTPPKPQQTAPQPKKALDLNALTSKGFDNPERRAQIEAAMTAVCHDDFPDNEENIWTIRKYLDLKKMIFVMMEAEPNDVGYDMFVFSMRIAPGQTPDSIAVYALDQGDDFFLLSTVSDCPSDAPRHIQWEI